jgi:hypothetical protein
VRAPGGAVAVVNVHVDVLVLVLVDVLARSRKDGGQTGRALFVRIVAMLTQM